MVQEMFRDGSSRFQLASEARTDFGAGLRHKGTGVRKVLRQFVGCRFRKQRNELLVVQCPDLIQLHALLAPSSSFQVWTVRLHRRIISQPVLFSFSNFTDIHFVRHILLI